MRLHLLSLLLLTGCPVALIEEIPALDLDADGVLDDRDCDDEDDTVYPGADELCDDTDNDCDDLVDEDAVDQPEWYPDVDGDGYGNADESVLACQAPADWFLAFADDCDDSDAEINPDTLWYPDVDADGFGANDEFGTAQCIAPTGHVRSNDDCDDSADAVHPDAAEICDSLDNDCDGTVDVAATDASTFYADGDADQYGDPSVSVLACVQPDFYVSVAGDCNDTDNAINPDTPWYLDLDGDSWGDNAVASEASCLAPSGDHVRFDGDCDDTDARLHPESDWYLDFDGDTYGRIGVPTIPNSCGPYWGDGMVLLSDDCDDFDERIHPDTLWAVDNDGDGYGEADNITWAQCESPFPADSSYVPDATDCDDSDPSATPESIWYPDADGDGLGDGGAAVAQCLAPAGFIDVAGDCDDLVFGPACTGTVDDSYSTRYDGAPGSLFGGNVAFLGDVDGNGGVDIGIVGLAEDSNGGAVHFDQGAIAAGIIPAASLSARRHAESADLNLGAALFGRGDIDGDGKPEVVMGSPGASDGGAQSGTVWILWGDSYAGDRSILDELLVDEKAYRVSGTTAGDRVGSSVLVHATNTVIGAPLHDAESVGDAGKVYLMSGATMLVDRFNGMADLSDSELSIYGVEPDAQFGSQMVLYDLWGTGGDGMLITAPKWGNNEGTVWYESGIGSGNFPITDSGTGFLRGIDGWELGTSVANAGDVDGDGRDDIWAGAPGANGETGLVALVIGSVGSLPSKTLPSGADAIIEGPVGGVRFGDRIAGGLDVTGDGEVDLVVGSPDSDTGIVWILEGPFSGTTTVDPALDRRLQGSNTGDRFGAAIDVGHADGDARGDLLIGAPNEGDGRAYLVLGADL